MNQYKLYLALAQAAGYIGAGSLLGANLSKDGSNTAFWIGGILVLLGAILLGMSISAKSEKDKQPVVESSLGSKPAEQQVDSE